MAKNDGKYLESLVFLIEKSISPDSTIKHNFKMPVIGSSPIKNRQCDIVIWDGNEARRTITIVEVQDRIKRVGINDFDGWMQKCRDVGAQHLICVSKNEFPQSIREKAIKSGNTVRLITLKELPIDKLPLNFFKYNFNYRHIEILKVRKLEFSSTNKYFVNSVLLLNKSILDNAELFTFDKINYLSMLDLCKKAIINMQGTGHRNIKYPINRETLFYFHEGKFYAIKLELTFEWINKLYVMNVSTIVYEQDNYGVLSWILEAYHILPEGVFKIKIPITYNGSDYQIRNMMVELHLK